MELTARYLSFIRAKAHPFRSSVLEADDLCQEGLLGSLFSAARSYNPNKDASFKTYAGICIQNRIVAAYRACARKKNIPLGQLVSLNDQEASQLNIQGTSQALSNPETLLIDRENLEMVHQSIRQSLSRLAATGSLSLLKRPKLQ